VNLRREFVASICTVIFIYAKIENLKKNEMSIESRPRALMENSDCSIVKKPFIVVGNNVPVYFQNRWDVSSSSIGGGLWSTGMAVAHLFAEQPYHDLCGIDPFSCRRALELGSGNGFLSACFLASLQIQKCNKLDQFVVTDLDDHLPYIRHTLCVDNQELMTSVVTILPYKWGEPCQKENTELSSNSFDFIFGSDLAYRDDLYDPLIMSLLELSHDKTVILIGCTMQDTKPLFFDKLWKSGFTYTRISDEFLTPDYKGTSFGLFVIHKRKLSHI